ncbi:monovalent cation/H+ antiporter complex subunit F [Streptomyces sp. YIM 98790]|uniref:monovalent cation/H+ antiporter complex subunit F n=1 Tax=Streptomyces sp. YIM 98790 TaxID=2689077 RepID=UPI00140BC13F|nr:monovalent cation/H+ antiporter complex subunit F [Streptomyces sp. YIM 98790]
MVLVDGGLIVLGLALAATLVRIVAGPTDADRVVAVDLAFVVVVGALALLALRLDSTVPLVLVLVAALVGFLTTVALARRTEGGPS